MLMSYITKKSRAKYSLGKVHVMLAFVTLLPYVFLGWPKKSHKHSSIENSDRLRFIKHHSSEQTFFGQVSISRA